ncbi:MAG: glycosyltransferase [Anaeromicrobium sp.]|jgi:glycosyltransferase involved in cell wall biosynthesis|uniref:glycosyltransferase family 2 protein n=1 Tax=Anaeromicrobium sp. TaxID=1929132 RepID=UPI0025FBF2DB|nr:glycosyltransferase [Anaeromicrobium sp.]MCT4592698.1 glycosyltransferase [Anaeromicrobium sp.]
MNTPMVSIVIPVYNGQNYLKEAIDSALSQTYSNFEVIVVNDGSNDGGITEKIALSYGTKIRYFYKENGGVATALNLAIQEMRGQYFSWLSHDDMYYPNKLNREIQALQEHGDMSALVYSDYDILEVETNTIDSTNLSKIFSLSKLTNSVFPILQNIIHGCTLLIHKSHFERVGLFDEKLITTQDYDMWYRMFRGQKTIFIPESLIKIRIHKESGTNTISCFTKEVGTLYMKFINSLSDKEIDEIFIHPAILYNKIAGLMKDYALMEEYKIVMEKLMRIDGPQNIWGGLEKFKECIDSFSNGNAEKICVFGAGHYGERLYYDLHSRLIKIDLFADNNPEKWGSSINGVSCISPKQLYEIKNNTLVIVAMRTPTEVVLKMKNDEYPYVITKQQLDGKIAQTIPLNNSI